MNNILDRKGLGVVVVVNDAAGKEEDSTVKYCGECIKASPNKQLGELREIAETGNWQEFFKAWETICGRNGCFVLNENQHILEDRYSTEVPGTRELKKPSISHYCSDWSEGEGTVTIRHEVKRAGTLKKVINNIFENHNEHGG